MKSLGIGVGLRSQHFNHILSTWPKVDWFEVISENFLDNQGWPKHVLQEISKRYPVVMHGVSLSIGSTDPINYDYLKSLKALAAKTNPRWISDHLCWTGMLGQNTHDLLPMPLTEESLQHVVERIRTVQDFLERPLVLENPSSYLQFSDDTLSEWEFISLMSKESGCYLLLDVNNVYVSSVNHGFDPVEYINSVPADRVIQFHLAGHTDFGTHIIDTHDGPVIEQVWQLYRLAQQRSPNASTLLEWDDNIPSFDEMHAEALKAKEFINQKASFDRIPAREISISSNKMEPNKNVPVGAHPPIMPLEETNE